MYKKKATLLALLLFFAVLTDSKKIIAQSQSSIPPIPEKIQNLEAEIRDKNKKIKEQQENIKKLQEELTQSQEFILDKFKNNDSIRNFIRDEVKDRFGTSFSLINLLLLYISLASIAATVYFLWLRITIQRGISTQIQQAIQPQIRGDIERDIRQQLNTSIQDMERQLSDLSKNLRTKYEESISGLDDENQRISRKIDNFQNIYNHKIEKFEKAIKKQKDDIMLAIDRLLPPLIENIIDPAGLQKINGYINQIESASLVDLDLEWSSQNYRSLADAYFYLENYAQSINYYKKCIETDEKNASVWNNMGFALSKLDKFKEEMKCYNKAIEISPNFLESLYNKVCCFVSLGEYDEALQQLENAIKFNPQCREWAIDDPDLEHLRINPYKDSFDKLIKI